MRAKETLTYLMGIAAALAVGLLLGSMAALLIIALIWA
jgi:hypothetical protein